MRKANGKVMYAACLILLVGTIYLFAQADAFFSLGSTTIKGDVIQLSKNEILSHLRSILTIILCFTGGILLLKIKSPGWIISQAILLLLLSILTGILLSNMSNIKELNISGIGLIGGISLLLLAILFLMQNKTRQKFNINRKSFLAVLLIFVLLSVFYFFLQ